MLAIVKCMRHWCHYLEGSRNPIQVLSDHDNLKTFMTTKALNHRQARWAELLANYDFVLVPISGTKNPVDGPSCCPDYTQNVPVPISSLIPPSALCLLLTESSIVSNTLFSSLVGVHAAVVPEPGFHERIIASYPTDTVACQQLDFATVTQSTQFT